MKKTLVAIFAHPDDEAFGPSGTLFKLAKEYDVYLLCATKGEIGENSGPNEKPLHEIRADELRESAAILGIKEVRFLGFTDGTLSNSLYHKLAAEIEKHLIELAPEIILTSNPNGVSGHIDHIVVSMVSSYEFQRLDFVKKIMYTAASLESTEKNKEIAKDYFIYRPPGIPRSQIDKIVDVSDVWDIKLKAMEAHKSQEHDYKRMLKMKEGLPREEYFMIREK